MRKKQYEYKEGTESIATYMKEIRKFPLLTRKEEVELGTLALRGDEEAQDRLIRSNLRLVVKIANTYANLGVSLADLVSEGNAGLAKAASRYDPEFGVKFSTYASWWIKQTIMLALGNQARTIRVPIYVQDRIRKLDRSTNHLACELGREATTEELAQDCDLTPEKVIELRSTIPSVISLDADPPDDVGENKNLAEIVPDPSVAIPSDAADQADQKSLINQAMIILNEREKKIIVARFGLDGEEPKSLEEIGNVYHVTRERIRQIQVVALRKIASALKRLQKGSMFPLSIPGASMQAQEAFPQELLRCRLEDVSRIVPCEVPQVGAQHINRPVHPPAGSS